MRGGRGGRQHTRNGQGNRLQGLRGAKAHERAAAATVRQEKRLDGISTEWAWHESLGLLLGTALPSLVLADVAAVDERVRGGEGTAGTAECVAWCVLQPLVQVKVVLALAAVAAAVAVEGALARVHAPVLYQLVGRLGQVATPLAAVVVAQAVGARVPLQLGPARPHRLADAAAVLRLVVRLQVALHGRRPAGGVHAQRAPGHKDRR